MLYPTLEVGHDVLEKDYCSGYTDAFGKWNTGFYCPATIPEQKVHCCGTPLLKYCCTLGAPIPGGQYSKGYDSTLQLDVDDEDLTDHQIPHIPPPRIVDEDQLSLYIGIICGLVGVTLLITVISCFYCSCCIIYKKRRGGHHHPGAFLYNLPPSSSSTTTCGLLTSLSGVAIGTPGRGGSTGQLVNVSSGGGTQISNFMTATGPMNHLDFWSTSGSGVTPVSGGNTVLVAATASSMSPPQILSGPGGEVYHHHHHYTSSPAIPPLLPAVPPPAPLEPPPPYLAVAGQIGCCDGEQHQRQIFGLSSVVVPTSGATTMTLPHRNQASRGSTGSGISTLANPPNYMRPNNGGSSNSGRSRNANLMMQRQLPFLHNQQINQSPTVLSSETPSASSSQQPRNFSPGRANLVTSSAVTPAAKSLVGKSPISVVTSSSGGTTGGNSPNIEGASTSRSTSAGRSTMTTSSSSTSTNNGSNTTANVLTRMLTGGRGTGGGGLTSLPPPYFVEQYRIRNRVRPPPFPSAAGTGTSNNSTSSSTRNRTQDTLQSLLYPLLNSAAMARHATSSSGGTEHSRATDHHHHHHHHYRLPERGGDTTTSPSGGLSDTHSEPRRHPHRHHHHHRHPTNLHRSTSDRQPGLHSTTSYLLRTEDGSGGLRESPTSPRFHDDNVEMMNNLINNLSAQLGPRGGRSSITPSRLHQGASSTGGRAEDMRRAQSAGEGVEEIGDNLGKILNTNFSTQHVTTTGTSRDHSATPPCSSAMLIPHRAGSSEPVADSYDRSSAPALPPNFVVDDDILDGEDEVIAVVAPHEEDVEFEEYDEDNSENSTTEKLTESGANSSSLASTEAKEDDDQPDEDDENMNLMSTTPVVTLDDDESSGQIGGDCQDGGDMVMMLREKCATAGDNEGGNGDIDEHHRRRLRLPSPHTNPSNGLNNNLVTES